MHKLSQMYSKNGNRTWWYVLSYHRSPDEEAGSPDADYNKSLSDRLFGDKSKTQTPFYKKRYKSSLTWAGDEDIVDCRTDDIIMTPSAVVIEPR